MAVDTSTVQVVMPAMGDSVAEGTVLEWHKSEGDKVAADETIVEISTDKVDAEVPAPVAGTIVKIAAGDGAGSGNGGPATATATATTEPEAEPETERIVEIVTPTGGESVTEGTI